MVNNEQKKKKKIFEIVHCHLQRIVSTLQPYTYKNWVLLGLLLYLRINPPSPPLKYPYQRKGGNFLKKTVKKSITMPQLNFQ